MKTANLSLKFFQRTVVATVAIIAGLISVRPAQAGYIVTLEQVGSNVVANGSGALDLTGLGFFGPLGTPSRVAPNAALILTGAFPTTYSVYRGVPIIGPPSFGSGANTFASSGSGDEVGIRAGGGSNELYVPQGYLSDTPLLDSATYNNATFASLGVDPGTYEWTWGTGPDQNFTLVVPDSGSTLGLLVGSLIALFGISRLRKRLVA